MGLNNPLGHKKAKAGATTVVHFMLREPFKHLSLCLFRNSRSIVGYRNFNLSLLSPYRKLNGASLGVNFSEFPIKLNSTRRILL